MTDDHLGAAVLAAMGAPPIVVVRTAPTRMSRSASVHQTMPASASSPKPFTGVVLTMGVALLRRGIVVAVPRSFREIALRLRMEPDDVVALSLPVELADCRTPPPPAEPYRRLDSGDYSAVPFLQLEGHPGLVVGPHTTVTLW
jgi:hypothetical protein